MSKNRTEPAKHYAIVKCTKCGDEIMGNTQKNLVYCTCKAISVDGCEYYMRINDNEGEYEVK